MINIPSDKLEELKNMTLEDFKEFYEKEEMTKEEMEEIKQVIERNVNIRNTLNDLVEKHGVESIIEMLKILLEDLELCFNLIPKFKNFETNNYNCCKENDEGIDKE